MAPTPRPAALSLLVAAGLLPAAGCVRPPADRPPPALAATVQPAPLCAFGPLTSGTVRAHRAGLPFARFHGGRGEARLDRRGGGLRIALRVELDGWRLEGWSDPAEDWLLRVRRAGWLHPGVALSAGAAPRILDARPGEVRLGLTGSGLGIARRIRFLVPVERWVPCAELTLEQEYRDDRTAARDRTALGFPGELPRKAIGVAPRPAPLSVEPGGPPFAEVPVSEGAFPVLVLEERDGQSRVLIQDWTGLALVGWTRSEALEDHASTTGGGGLGLLGGLRGPRSQTVCTSPEPLALQVAFPGSGPEPVGTLAPGTRFVRGAPGADGTVEVSPHPSSRLVLVSLEVPFAIAPSAPLACSEETHDPVAVLGALLPAPTARLVVRAEVVAAEGLAGVAAGSGCEARVAYFARDRLHPCRVEVRCGEQVLYGHRPTNGFLPECEVDLEARPPAVRGADRLPSSAGGGDGEIDLDSTAGRLLVADDAPGHLGAFRLEARVLSVELEPVGEPGPP